MHRTVRTAVAVTVAVTAIPAAVASAQPADDVQQLRQQVAAARVDLAQANLELAKIIADLREFREFMASPDIYEDIRAWRAQRQQLADTRAELAGQRKSIESTKQTYVETARQRALQAQQDAAEAARTAPRWQFDYKVAAIPTGQNSQLTYVDPISGTLLVQRFPDIDRANIMLRGTIQNRSGEAWRYTFDVRVANVAGRIIGSWRYQTPLLAPNELHPFELKIPVTDVAEIDRYQIGNIEADRPGSATGTAPVVNQPTPPTPPAPQTPAVPEPYYPKTPR